MRITKYNVMLDENRKNILVAESTKNYPSLGNAKAADKIVDVMNVVFEADRQAEEHVWLMAMDAKCKIIGIFEVTHGAVSTSVASTREIFVRLCLCGASIFALCHNHPSGDPSPSNEDCLFTKKLEEASKLMDIHLVDHIIIGDHCYYSFSENGLLEELS